MTIDSGKPTPEAQLQSFYDRIDPEHQKFIRSVQAALRKRLPTANELVYDYSSFFVISYSPTKQGIKHQIDRPFSPAPRSGAAGGRRYIVGMQS